MGLQTLASHRRSLKLGYWRRLCVAPRNRLLSSLVFRRRHAEVLSGGAQWSHLNAMLSLSLELDMEEEWQSREVFCKREWDVQVSSSVGSASYFEERELFLTHSTLSVYAGLGHSASRGVAPYLNDTSNKLGTRLMTKARFGHLLLKSTGCTCVRCAVEDMRHFLMDCPVMVACREHLLRDLRTLLPMAGVPGLEFFARVEIGGDARLRVILGGGLLFGSSDPAHRELWLRALVSQPGKNEFSGRVTGRLVGCSSNKVYEVEVAKQRAATVQCQHIQALLGAVDAAQGIPLARYDRALSSCLLCGQGRACGGTS